VGASSKNTVRLEWVVYEGLDTHVSAFGGIPAGGRPDVTCPECGERLVLRLGKIRAWHAAHHVGGQCALTEPESALHHNAKMFLAEQLRRACEVSIEESCVGTVGGLVADDCEETRTRPWVHGWCSVEVERTVRTRRPDIVLLHGDRVVGAVEVWVSHRVEQGKRDAFADWQMEWVEVAATEALIDGSTAWTATQPLAVVSTGPDAPFTCSACERHRVLAEEQLAEAARLRQQQEADRRAAEEAWKARQAELQAAKDAAEQADRDQRRAFGESARQLRARLSNNGVLFKRIRLFDCLLVGGAVQRDALVVADVYKDGAKVGAFLGVAGSLEILHKIGAASGRAGYTELGRRADAHLQSLRDTGGIVDAELNWFPMLRVLDDRDFVGGWDREGTDHQWPATEGSPPSPWRVPWAAEGVDCLDLLRFLFVRYFAGLPVRHRWSEKTQGWFQPAILREEIWRLWPGDLSRSRGGQR
jgi:hypothetical protein